MPLKQTWTSLLTNMLKEGTTSNNGRVIDDGIEITLKMMIKMYKKKKGCDTKESLMLVKQTIILFSF